VSKIVTDSTKVRGNLTPFHQQFPHRVFSLIVGALAESSKEAGMRAAKQDRAAQREMT
jgi:hypothetical protein